MKKGKSKSKSPMTPLTIEQFTGVQDEAKSMPGYDEKLFTDVLASLKEKQLIVKLPYYGVGPMEVPSGLELLEHQFHTIWTESVGRPEYNKKFFQKLFNSLETKKCFVSIASLS